MPICSPNASREASISKDPQGHAWVAYLAREFRATMTGIGLWFDTSEQTPEETVDQILDARRPSFVGVGGTPYAVICLPSINVCISTSTLGSYVISLQLRQKSAQSR